MAIHQTQKQTDLEKRLKILRQQVYGRADQELRTRSYELGESKVTANLGPSSTNHFDITYLRYDLLKISLLTSLAFGIQLIFFYLLQNNILRLNFF